MDTDDCRNSANHHHTLSLYAHHSPGSSFGDPEEKCWIYIFLYETTLTIRSCWARAWTWRFSSANRATSLASSPTTAPTWGALLKRVREPRSAARRECQSAWHNPKISTTKFPTILHQSELAKEKNHAHLWKGTQEIKQMLCVRIEDSFYELTRRAPKKMVRLWTTVSSRGITESPTSISASSWIPATHPPMDYYNFPKFRSTSVHIITLSIASLYL